MSPKQIYGNILDRKLLSSTDEDVVEEEDVTKLSDSSDLLHNETLLGQVTLILWLSSVKTLQKNIQERYASTLTFIH